MGKSRRAHVDERVGLPAPRGSKRRDAGGTRWHAFLALVPLAVLGLDVIACPVFFETRDVSAAFSAEQMMRTGASYFGNFKAHRIYVSLDNISDPNGLTFLTASAESGRGFWHRTGNALALSIVQVGGNPTGSLLKSVLSRLPSGPGGDRDGLINLLMQAGSDPHDVLWHDFGHVGSVNRKSFPIDHLLLLKLGEQKKEAYPKEMVELLRLAQREGLSSLVLPCLGVNPGARSKDWLSCGDTFTSLFQGLGRSESPRAIYLSLYSQLPTETITDDLRSLTAAWKDAVGKEVGNAGALPIIYQADLRLFLLFLSVCLLVCSYRVELTLKSFVIICLLFGPAALGLEDKLAPLLRDVAEPIPVWVIKALLLALLSGGFLFFADLDVEGFLKSHGRKAAS